MVDVEKIRLFVEERLGEGELFLVDIVSLPGGEIEVIVDSDSSVGIDACVELSRAVEDHFGDLLDDHSLTVASSGIGRPLKLTRQYKKLIGKSVAVVLNSGVKIVARLTEADENSITLSYTRLEKVEGQKKKLEVEVVERYPLADVKSTAEHLDFS